jgi:hypothetical protein
MAPNSRRVRWLSANKSQWYRACLISRPPVFTSPCRNLVKDQPPPQVPQVVGDHAQTQPNLVRTEAVATLQYHLRLQPWQLCAAHVDVVSLVV